MSGQSFAERIAARQVSLGLVLGILIVACFAALTLILQFWLRWIDLSQNLTDLWIWILYVVFGAGFTLINVSLWRSRRASSSLESKPDNSIAGKSTICSNCNREFVARAHGPPYVDVEGGRFALVRCPYCAYQQEIMV